MFAYIFPLRCVLKSLPAPCVACSCRCISSTCRRAVGSAALKALRKVAWTKSGAMVESHMICSDAYNCYCPCEFMIEFMCESVHCGTYST